LIAIAEDTNLTERVRTYAVTSLGLIRDGAAAAIPCLLKLVKAQNGDMLKGAAITALGLVGKKHDTVLVPVLLGLLKEEQSNFRTCAAAALADIGKQPAVVVPALLEQLKKEKPGRGSARGRMLGSLGMFGCHAKPAVPVVLEILRNPQEDFSYPIQSQAIQVLGAIGPEAKEAVPTLIQIREDDTSIYHLFLQKEAAKALAAIQGTSR